MLYLTPKKWVNCLTYYGRKPQQRRFPFIGENLITFGGFLLYLCSFDSQKVGKLSYLLWQETPTKKNSFFLLYLSSFCSQKCTYSSHKLGKFFLCLIPYLKQICKGNEAHFMGARLTNRERGEFIHISVLYRQQMFRKTMKLNYKSISIFQPE